MEDINMDDGFGAMKEGDAEVAAPGATTEGTGGDDDSKS